MNKVEEFLEARVNEKSRIAYRCHLNNFFSTLLKHLSNIEKFPM